MATTSRDRLIENKLSILERRLVLVERFVELRFCESFRDFSIRHDNISIPETLAEKKVLSSGGSNEPPPPKRRGRKPKGAAPLTINSTIFVNDIEDDHNDEGGADISEVEASPANCSTTRTRSGRSTRPPARLSDVKPPLTRKSITNTVKIQLVRLEDDRNVRGTTPSSKSPVIGASTTNPAIPIIKTAPLSEDEAMYDDGGDDYFTFPNDSQEVEANETSQEKSHNNDLESQDTDQDQDYDPSCGLDDDDRQASEDDDLSSEPASDVESPPTKRRKAGRRAYGSLSKRSISTPSGVKRTRRKKPRPAIVSSGQPLPIESLLKVECEVCHKFFRKELMPGHMEFHTKERHLKCRWCDKTFFNKSMVIKHEKLHQPEKYARKCRLCDKTTIESGKMLVHERSCIRRALEQNKFVDPRLLEEIRQRSRGMDLKWPDTPGTTAAALAVASSGGGADDRKCTHCGQVFPLSLYTRHLKTHATWKCTMCLEKAYMNKEGLVKHMRNFHGVVEEEITEDAGEDDAQKDSAEEEARAIVDELVGTKEIVAAQNVQKNGDGDTPTVPEDLDKIEVPTLGLVETILQKDNVAPDTTPE